MKNTKTLVLSPTFSITINVCDREFHFPLGKITEEHEAIAKDYYEQSEFWQAYRALPADLTGLDLQPVYELTTTRGEESALYKLERLWRPKFTELSDVCNAPLQRDGLTSGVGQREWADAHLVKELRANSDELEAIHKRTVQALRKAGLDFDDLRRYHARRSTFWITESEETVEAIVLRGAEIVRESDFMETRDSAEAKAAREFYEAKE